MDETQFIFEREIELEDSLSDSETSIESIDGQGSNDVNIDDDLDPVTFCSPRYFAFNEGTYDLWLQIYYYDLNLAKRPQRVYFSRS